MNPKLINSFNEIYSEYYPKSFAFVKSYVHDEMAAEDIVSDSLIKLWEILKSGPIDPIGPFLFKMLKNKSLDYLKHLTVRRDLHDNLQKTLTRELEIRTFSLESTDPNEIFSSEIQLIIEQTLQRMPERTREIFLMSRFGDKSYKEIAEIFDMTTKGVEYHMSLALKDLKASLTEYLPFVVWLFLLKS